MGWGVGGNNCVWITYDFIFKESWKKNLSRIESNALKSFYKYLNVLVSVIDGLFRNVSEDDCKICVINYDRDLKKI